MFSKEIQVSPSGGSTTHYRLAPNALVFGFLALILILSMAGCGTPGYLKTENIEGTLGHIMERHDAYVEQDKSLSDLERRVYQRDTELIRKALEESKEPTETDDDQAFLGPVRDDYAKEGQLNAWGKLFLGLYATQLTADGQGALTQTKGVSEGYIADAQTAVWEDDMDGTDTLTALDDPVTKFGASRLFQLSSSGSASNNGPKVNLKLSARFSNSGASGTFWVAYYYYNGTTYTFLDLDQPLGGTLTATAATENSLYIAKTAVLDTFAATHAVIICDSISAGTVDVWVGSY